MSRVRCLVVVAVIAVVASSACSDGGAATREVNGQRGLVCNTDHVKAEVEWIVRNGWEGDGLPIVEAVAAMPGIDLSTIDKPDGNGIPRLIGARIAVLGSGDDLFLWYVPLGTPNLANFEDFKSLANGDSIPDVLDQVRPLFVDIGSHTKAVFPTFANAVHEPDQGVIDTALQMNECLSGSPEGS